MRIQFFNPPIHHYANFQYRMLPNIGVPTLVAWLNLRGHYAEAVDLEALAVHPDQFREKFAQQKDRWPDVVGVTSLTISRRGAREIVQAVRAAGFTGPVAVGGVHATMFPEEALGWGADLVVTGECEGNVVELLTSGAKGIHAGVPAPIEDIPAPDWLHWSPAIASYRGNVMSLLQPNPGISMWTRGCPFKCIMCNNVVFGGRRTRYCPPWAVEADMAQLKALRVRNVYVYDDELVGGPGMPAGWMTEIADRIQPLGLRWIAQGRCSRKHITAELMRDAKRAGCHTIFWGLESFSASVLRTMKKGATPEDNWHTLRVAHEAGIHNALFTMIGNYGETDEDLELTCQELAKAYREGLVQMRQTTVVTPMPGTKLAEIAKAEGWYEEPPDCGQQMLQTVTRTWLPPERVDYWFKRFWDACPVGMS